ncbi:MAG: hypothetical protein [Caudoviricetes sp.]|nr:MAG: hypothetical protein [Caudoviricetes sp.]
MSKICKHCKQDLPLKRFRTSENSDDGFFPLCINCTNLKKGWQLDSYYRHFPDQKPSGLKSFAVNAGFLKDNGVNHVIFYPNQPEELHEYRIPNKNGNFVLRVDKDLEQCSMQFNGSSGRYDNEDLIKLKQLLNACKELKCTQL